MRHDVELRYPADEEKAPGEWCSITLYDAEGVCVGQLEVGLYREFEPLEINVSAVVKAGVMLKTECDARTEVKPR